MVAWKMSFLFKGGDFRFHVGFSGVEICLLKKRLEVLGKIGKVRVLI